MRTKSHRIGEGGAALLGVLIVLFTISLIAVTLVSFFLSVTTAAEVELARAQALYLAEAGVASAIHQLREASLTGGEVSEKIQSASMGEGEYRVSNDLSTGLITSVGVARGVRRTIQVKYRSL